MQFFAGFQKKVWPALIWVLLFSLALALTYWPVISAGPDRFAGRYDVYRYFGPNAFYMDTAIHGGEFPLWNPLVYCGMPFAANPQTAAFYPPNIVRSLLNFHPTPGSTQQSLVILMGLHLLLAAAGAYLLGRAHGMSRPGACAAAMAFTFSALMVRRACEYHFLYTLNWLPLILLCVKQAIDQPGLLLKLKNAAGAGSLMGVAILGGFFQIVTYMAIAMAAYAVTYRLLHLPPPGRKTGQFKGDALAFVTAVLTAALIGAAVLVPAAELARFAARQPDAEIGQYSDLSQGGVTGLIQGLVVYAGMGYHPETVRGSGVSALLLALAAVILARRRDVAAFLVPFLVLLDTSIGPPMPVATFVEWATPFATSASTRAFDVALLPLSMLAGFGVSAIVARDGTRLVLAFRTVAHAALGAGLLALLAWSLAQKPFLLPSDAVFIVPAVALVMLAVGPWMPSRGVRVAFQILLAALILCETLAWNRHYVPWLIGGGRPAPQARARAWPLESRNQRYVDPLANHAVFELKPLMNGYDPLHLREVRKVVSGPPRDRRYHRLVTAEEPTAASHRGNLFLERPFWLARAWTPGPLPPKDKLFPAATIVFLQDAEGICIEPVSRAGVKESSLSAAVRMPLPVGRSITATIPSGASRRVMSGVRLPREIAECPAGSAGAIHRAILLHYTSTSPAKVETHFRDVTGGRSWRGKNLAIPSSGNYAGQAELPVPDFAAAEVTMSISAGRGGSFRLTDVELLADPRDEDNLIRIVRWGANSVEVEVKDLPGERILLFTDAAYPGWQAFVDSAPATIYRADDAFKAVCVPAGTHRVRFVFRPVGVYVGIGVSLVGSLLLALACLAIRSRQRRGIAIAAGG